MQTEAESKKQWNASLPYPVWPFGAVNPKELVKWERKQARTNKSTDKPKEALL